jgi:hypothetical protein
VTNATSSVMSNIFLIVIGTPPDLDPKKFHAFSREKAAV